MPQPSCLTNEVGRDTTLAVVTHGMRGITVQCKNRCFSIPEADGLEKWINQAGETTLAQVFRDYGEERFAKRIARAIVKSRSETPIRTTTQLAKIIADANPAWEQGKDPATRCFQAIRIFINKELEDLQQFLPQSLALLSKGGRLAVISFHSLEDRIVKRFIRDQSRGDHYPPDLPIQAALIKPKLRPVGKAIYPDEHEVNVNPRARSAVLRVAERAGD